MTTTLVVLAVLPVSRLIAWWLWLRFNNRLLDRYGTPSSNDLRTLLEASARVAEPFWRSPLRRRKRSNE